MAPISRVATGFLLAFLAVRINGFDLLVDAVGWVIVASALARLEMEFGFAFSSAKTASVIAFVVSLADIVGWTEQPLVGLIYSIMKLACAWSVTVAIIQRAEVYGDASTERKFDTFRRFLAFVIVTMPLLAIGGAMSYTAPAAVGMMSNGAPTALDMMGPIGLIAVVVQLIAMIWLVVLLYRSARLPYLLPTALPQNSA